jgi:hypothetical protein
LFDKLSQLWRRLLFYLWRDRFDCEPEGANPIERHLDKNMLIVGVVGDTALSSAAKLNAGSAPLTSEETIYLPVAQTGAAKSLSMVHGFFQPSWLVRAAGPVGGLTVRMQRALASADPDLPFSGFYRSPRTLRRKLFNHMTRSHLIRGFASGESFKVYSVASYV